jgi:hypothetical protein
VKMCGRERCCRVTASEDKPRSATDKSSDSADPRARGWSASPGRRIAFKYKAFL